MSHSVLTASLSSNISPKVAAIWVVGSSGTNAVVHCNNNTADERAANTLDAAGNWVLDEVLRNDVDRGLVAPAARGLPNDAVGSRASSFVVSSRSPALARGLVRRGLEGATERLGGGEMPPEALELNEVRDERGERRAGGLDAAGSSRGDPDTRLADERRGIEVAGDAASAAGRAALARVGGLDGADVREELNAVGITGALPRRTNGGGSDGSAAVDGAAGASATATSRVDGEEEVRGRRSTSGKGRFGGPTAPLSRGDTGTGGTSEALLR